MNGKKARAIRKKFGVKHVRLAKVRTVADKFVSSTAPKMTPSIKTTGGYNFGTVPPESEND